MKRPEQKVWSAMKGHVPGHLWCQRVENIMVDGMPDLHITGPGASCWVELKHADLPVRPTTAVLGRDGLSQDQMNWHRKCCQMGGKSFVLVRDSNLELYLFRGRHADLINGWNVSEMREHSIASTWAGIFSCVGARYGLMEEV